MAATLDKCRLDELLGFVRSPFGWLGAGLRTYSDGQQQDPYGNDLHETCLGLERRGLLRRARERTDSGGVLMIHWQPTEGYSE